MNRILAILVVLVCTSVPLVSALPQQYVTRDCAVFLQLDRIPALIDEVERYAISFGLGLSRGDLSKKISSGIFGQEGFPGIDLRRPVAMFLLYQGQKMSGGVFMVPVSDQNLFRTVVLSRLPLGDSPIQYRDGYAIIASSPAVMASFNGGQKKPVTLVSEAQLSIYVDMALFKDEIQKAIQQYTRYAQGSDARLMRSAMLFYADWLKEMRGASYSLSLNQKGIELGYTMDLVPGGKMAAMLAATPAGSPDLIGAMPADSYVALGSRMNLKASLPYLEPVMGMFETVQPELGTILKEYLRDASLLYGDDYAMALVPSKASGVTILGAVRQGGGSTQALYRKLVDRLNGLRFVQRVRQEDARFGLVYEASAGTVSGVRYDTIRLDFTDPADSSEETRRQVAFVREVLTCHVAFKDGVEYWAMGTDAKNRLAGMLDGRAPAFRTSPAWRTMTASWGQYAKNGLMYFSLSGLLREVVAVIKRFDPDNAQTRVVEGMLTRLPQDGGIYAMTRYAHNAVTVRGLVSESEIQAIAQFFLMAFGAAEKSAIGE